MTDYVQSTAMLTNLGVITDWGLALGWLALGIFTLFIFLFVFSLVVKAFVPHHRAKRRGLSR